MILCSSKDEKVEPLRPPKDSQPGDLVYIGDLPREPASDKKCPWSKVCDDLIVNDQGKATYKNELIDMIYDLVDLAVGEESDMEEDFYNEELMTEGIEASMDLDYYSYSTDFGFHPLIYLLSALNHQFFDPFHQFYAKKY